MQDMKFTSAGIAAEEVAAEVLPDLERLAVLLQAIEALAGGAAALNEDGPLDHIEAMASMMGSRVSDMRARLERLAQPV